MNIDIDYEILENRIKQGFAAGIGSFAMIAVAAFRISQERGFIANPKTVFKFAGAASAIAGFIWSTMPAAKEKPSDTIDKAKEQIYPAFKVGLKRLLDSENMLQSEVENSLNKSRSDTPSYRRPFDNSVRPSFDSKVSRDTSLSRVEKRYPLARRSDSFDMGFEGTDLEEARFKDRDSLFDDDDILSDSEVEDILRDSALDDPFYEGPDSPFDRL